MKFEFILFLIISGCVFSCATKAPIDFSLLIVDDVDKIDTKNQLLTRQYLFKDSTIKLEFTEKDLDKIYSKYLKYGLDALPLDYNPKCNIHIIPTFFSELTISINGNKRKITYNGSFQCEDLNDKRQIENIGLFLKYIEELIKEKPQYKGLKETNLVFL
jgi:hypothetical protein